MTLKKSLPIKFGQSFPSSPRGGAAFCWMMADEELVVQGSPGAEILQNGDAHGLKDEVEAAKKKKKKKKKSKAASAGK